MILLKKLQNQSIQVAFLILLIGLLLVFIPHFAHLPLWLSLVMVGLLIWRGAYDLQLCARPNKFVLFILTLMLLVALLFSYRTLIGRDAGSAMLLGLLCLKLFEITSFRDIALIINLALFSIVINFLFSQSIPVAFTMLFALVFLFSALIGFQHNYKKLHPIQPMPISAVNANEKQHLKLAFKMLAQAVPFAVVLFILFPRVDGPLWGLPKDAFSRNTGLSDQMSPGRISQLSDDNSPAFRVKFDGPLPATNQLYWRGPVLWHFDGYNWTTPDKERMVVRSINFTGLSEKTTYFVTLQPHNNHWLFALDLPSTLPERSRFSANMQVISIDPVQKLKRYEISSYTKYVLPANNQISMERYLKLPNTFSQEPDSQLYKSRKLIAELKDAAHPENTVKNVLSYIATNDFYYSRNPPLLYSNPVDEFLFETKRGYCEHYASSFTILMRLAGIPSRVVTGYQGGEINPIDNYMVVRQSDAHAWSEVYLGDKGWVRVDPTAAIPPSNIENNDDALRLNSALEKPSRLFKTNWLSKQMKKMRFALDAMNNRWDQWVLGYNNKRQKALLAALGIPEIGWQGLSQLLFSILAVLVGLLALIVFSNKILKKDQTQYYYLKFVKKLKKYGLNKKTTEGANDFCLRSTVKLPEQKDHIQKVTSLYHELRYSVYKEKNYDLFKKLVKQKL